MTSSDHVLPPGTPAGAASRLLPVWCTHGTRWEPEQAGYRPTVIDDAHPDLVCRSVGAIPEPCQPTYGYDPKDPR